MKNSLNQEKIQELRELDDDGEVLKELIGLYLPGTEKKISRLLELKSAPTATDIRPIAHEMRSSSANVGADILSELATKLEYMTVDESYQTNISILIDEMKIEFDRVKKELETLQ